MKEFVRFYQDSVQDISKYYERRVKRDDTGTEQAKIKAARFQSFNHHCQTDTF